MKKAVYGVVTTNEQAESIIDGLRTAGFSSNDISVLLPDKKETRDFAHEKHTKAPEGGSIGAGAGGLTGGILGWLAGIGSLAIPGVGPFIAAGPIMAALSGAALGAAAGGLVGSLVGLGIPEYEAKAYEDKIKKGGILIAVHTDDGKERSAAKDVLKAGGAEDISSTGEAAA